MPFSQYFSIINLDCGIGKDKKENLIKYTVLLTVYSSMKPGKRIFFSIYGALIISLFTQLFFSDYGLMKRAQLIEYKELLEKNINELAATGSILEKQSRSLRSDYDTVALLARDLGYKEDQEILVHLEGYVSPPVYYNVGKTITRNEGTLGEGTSTWYITLSSALIIFMVLSFLHRKNYGR